MASGPAMSSRAASAAQASRKEAATTAAPKATRLSAAGGCAPVRRKTRAGAVSATHPAIGWPIGRASFGDMTSLRDGRAARTEGQGTPARRLCWPKVSPTLGRALPPEGRGALSMSTTGCRTTPLQTTAILAVILLIAQLTICL